MDDAKILLKQKSGEVYTNAMDVCLRLNKLYPESRIIWNAAFLISEKNKASSYEFADQGKKFSICQPDLKEL